MFHKKEREFFMKYVFLFLALVFTNNYSQNLQTYLQSLTQKLQNLTQELSGKKETVVSGTVETIQNINQKIQLAFEKGNIDDLYTLFPQLAQKLNDILKTEISSDEKDTISDALLNIKNIFAQWINTQASKPMPEKKKEFLYKITTTYYFNFFSKYLSFLPQEKLEEPNKKIREVIPLVYLKNILPLEFFIKAKTDLQELRNYLVQKNNEIRSTFVVINKNKDQFSEKEKDEIKQYIMSIYLDLANIFKQALNFAITIDSNKEKYLFIKNLDTYGEEFNKSLKNELKEMREFIDQKVIKFITKELQKIDIQMRKIELFTVFKILQNILDPENPKLVIERINANKKIITNFNALMTKILNYIKSEDIDMATENIIKKNLNGLIANLSNFLDNALENKEKLTTDDFGTISEMIKKLQLTKYKETYEIPSEFKTKLKKIDQEANPETID